jgi:uncharacterized MAPEG superfamily protein
MATRSLLLFSSWTLGFVGSVFLYRFLRFLTGTKINSWPRGTPNAEDHAVIRRMSEAHANALESLPVFAAIVLVAHAQVNTVLFD